MPVQVKWGILGNSLLNKYFSESQALSYKTNLTSLIQWWKYQLWCKHRWSKWIRTPIMNDIIASEWRHSTSWWRHITFSMPHFVFWYQIKHVCNTFIGSRSSQKKVSCTLKLWTAAILNLCKLTTFPGSKSWRLFICSSEGQKEQVKAKKPSIAICSRFS